MNIEIGSQDINYFDPSLSLGIKKKAKILPVHVKTHNTVWLP